jgi:radical SAM protein with 4Fe4S-binding SPASM domain
VPLNYRKYKELKTREAFSILDQLADMGCFYLGFTGGEPFIREDIMEILWYAKRKGFEVIIYTNGSLIDEKIAEELKHLRPNKVDITIPAMSEAAFERISGVLGSRDKVFRAIDLLHKRNVNLGFKTCVLKENEDEINQIQDFFSSIGALHRLDDMLSRCLDGSDEPFKYRGILETETDNQIRVTRYKEARDCELETKNQEPRTKNLFKCGVGVSQAAITPLGELKMCLMIDYPKYKIIRVSCPTSHATGYMLKEAWEKLKELVKNIKPDGDYKCSGCELQAYCKWCPAKSWLYKRNFTSCEPESCSKANLIRQTV